jgi:hypothetical protein
MDLKSSIFTDGTAASKFLEGQRWANGTDCPCCGLTDTVSDLPTKGAIAKG